MQVQNRTVQLVKNQHYVSNGVLPGHRFFALGGVWALDETGEYWTCTGTMQCTIDMHIHMRHAHTP